MKDWIIIDDFGFNVASVQAMTEKQFIAQYLDQRPFGMTEDQYLAWLKSAYAVIVPKKK